MLLTTCVRASGSGQVKGRDKTPHHTCIAITGGLGKQGRGLENLKDQSYVMRPIMKVLASSVHFKRIRQTDKDMNTNPPLEACAITRVCQMDGTGRSHVHGAPAKCEKASTYLPLAYTVRHKYARTNADHASVIAVKEEVGWGACGLLRCDVKDVFRKYFGGRVVALGQKASKAVACWVDE